MANKTDFEDFSDDFDEIVEADPEEEPEEEEETPKPVAPIKKVAPAPVIPKKTVPPPKRPVQPVIEEPEEEEEEPLPAPIIQAQKKKEKPTVAPARYVAYKTEKRYGLIDNLTGQPIAESADAEALTLTILSDILNKLDRIESSL